VRVARQVSPKLFDLAPHGLANACAEHLLFPVFNGGTLHPPRSQAEFHREFEQALQEAEEILNPVRNTYQTSLVRSFWRDMIRPSGPMGRTLAEARCQQFPAGRAGIDLFVEGHADWPKILAAYKHNIQNRMTEFGDLIEVARAAHLGGIEAKRPDNSHLPRQAVQEILEAVRHQGGSAWWLDAIEAGLAGM